MCLIPLMSSRLADNIAVNVHKQIHKPDNFIHDAWTEWLPVLGTKSSLLFYFAKLLQPIKRIYLLSKKKKKVMFYLLRWQTQNMQIFSDIAQNVFYHNFWFDFSITYYWVLIILTVKFPWNLTSGSSVSSTLSCTDEPWTLEGLSFDSSENVIKNESFLT